jgi:hypothetical protein
VSPVVPVVAVAGTCPEALAGIATVTWTAGYDEPGARASASLPGRVQVTVWPAIEHVQPSPWPTARSSRTAR